MYKSVMLTLTDEQLDWICERIPEPSHKGSYTTRGAADTETYGRLS